MNETLIKSSYKKYLEEHHQITESAIGVLKVLLRDVEVHKAISLLNSCSEELDEVTKKYMPNVAKLMEND